MDAVRTRDQHNEPGDDARVVADEPHLRPVVDAALPHPIVEVAVEGEGGERGEGEEEVRGDVHAPPREVTRGAREQQEGVSQQEGAGERGRGEAQHGTPVVRAPVRHVGAAQQVEADKRLGETAQRRRARHPA